MKFSDRVKALGLPLDEVVVIGSGLLDQLGLRQAHDIDLVASPRLFAKLWRDKSYQHGHRGNDHFCATAGLEIWDNWHQDAPYHALRANAEQHDGVWFVSRTTLIAKKRQRGGTKDMDDIAKLEML